MAQLFSVPLPQLAPHSLLGSGVTVGTKSRLSLLVSDIGSELGLVPATIVF